jgi:hypothetical protein
LKIGEQTFDKPQIKRISYFTVGCEEYQTKRNNEPSNNRQRDKTRNLLKKGEYPATRRKF